MEPTLAELAEHTEVHLLPRATFESLHHDGLVYIAGLRNANLHPYRIEDAAAAVEWSRAESRRRGHRDIEWWVGWTAQPADLEECLLSVGLARSADPPTLTGMICTSEPPAEPRVEVRLVRSEEHTSELQSPCNLVCRLLLEKKKTFQRLINSPNSSRKTSTGLQ